MRIMKMFVPDEKNEGIDSDGKDRDGSDMDGKLFLKLLNENNETLPLAASGWGTVSLSGVAAVAADAGFALLKLS